MRRPGGASSSRGGSSVATPALACLLTAALLSLAGCPQPVDSSGGGVPFLDRDGNFTFNSATALALGDGDELRFAGFIDGPNDVDVYKLGPIAPGDRLLIDVRRISGNLDAVAAVFDEREYLHAMNDDRSENGSNRDPLIDFVVRGGEGDLFLGIAAFEGSNSSGEYEVHIRVTRDVGVPNAPTQVVYLKWNGGRNLEVPNVGRFNLDPFDAADLGAAYAGRTEEFKDRVQEIVLERYRGYNLVLLNSDDHEEPTGPHTTIFFGGTSHTAFAISEHIDTMNADLSDRAIIFTSSYAEAFGGRPSFEQMAQAVGNTVAHEIGHLLGLVHTADGADLMDTTGGNRRILEPQTFKVAPLDSSVFPIGFQSAPDILEWVLGLAGL